MNQKILHEQEAEKTFLDLLSSEDSGVVISGCVGLMSMASLHSSKQLIGCEGGLTKLLQSAQSESGEVRANAARTIAMIISGAPANQKLARKGLIVHTQKTMGNGEGDAYLFLISLSLSLSLSLSFSLSLFPGSLQTLMVLKCWLSC